MCLSDLEKRAEETQDIELHQAVPRARVCDDYTIQPAAVADDDDHNTCINVKFPLAQVVSRLKPSRGKHTNQRAVARGFICAAEGLA